MFPMSKTGPCFNWETAKYKRNIKIIIVTPLNTNPTKWSNTFKKFVGFEPTNCLSVFDHFVGLALSNKDLINNKG